MTAGTAGAGAGAAAEVVADRTGAPAEVTGAAAEVTGAAAEVTGAAAEVTAGTAGAGGGAGAEVAAGAGAGAAAGLTGAVVEVTGAAAEVTADAAEPVPELVAGAELVPALVVSEVAACACRENTSRTARIPAATIATCTARRAMCRMIGCGMSSSPPPGQAEPGLEVPLISDPKHASGPLFRRGHPEPDICSPPTNAHTVRSPPYSTGLGPGKAADRG